MTGQSSAIVSAAPALSHRSGLGWGLVGVTAFSLTVPLTRLAADDGFPALLIGSGRAVVAAGLAVAVLLLTRQARPSRRQWARIAVVAAGVVAGFPLLTSYALVTAPASHGAVVIGLLPAATAVMAVLGGHERVPGSFWLFATLGAVAVVAFAALQNGGLGALHGSDLLLFGAVLAAAIGYAEGGLLARELGAWQTISWALVISAPVMFVLATVSFVRTPPAAGAVAWLAFGYLALVSAYLGFFAWYRGLAVGPMARVSQVQLVQPVLSIGWATLLLGEDLTWTTVLGGLAVIGCAGFAVRARLAG
ncbi:MAG: DMT family transporter [Nocardioidaceae bacterium]|nr:DMT family transporter [Nocardioidaceae bacterium]